METTAAPEPPGTRKRKVVEELKDLGLLSLYFFALLVGLSAYRAVLLSSYRIDPFRLGYMFLESVVLAKTILLGDLLHLGKRIRKRRLIDSTLASTGVFSLFVLAFKVLEHLLAGLIHGEAPAAVVDKLLHQGAPQILVHVLLMVLAFIPLFAIWETGRAMGGDKLFVLFFKKRTA
jgi:hypothetical protein